jgi:hypothetical protein
MFIHQELLSERGERLRRSSEKRRFVSCLARRCNDKWAPPSGDTHSCGSHETRE